MQVIEFKEFGSPSQLGLAERPLPQADANTAVVRIEAAAVNPSDLKNVAGRMSQTTLPRIPGRDYSGVVVDGPKQWIDRAVWGSGGDAGFTRDGSHAEYIQVPVASLVQKPERLSYIEAGAVGVTFVTAWCALVEYARLKGGETVAIFGAAGGVGGAAVQIANKLGARVVAIIRTGFGLNPSLARLAELQLDSSDPELPSILRSLTRAAVRMWCSMRPGGRCLQPDLACSRIVGARWRLPLRLKRRVSLDLVDFYHNEFQLLGVDTLKRDLTATASILEKLRSGFDAGAYIPPMIADTLSLNKRGPPMNLWPKAGADGWC